jgi:hypothetical protein
MKSIEKKFSLDLICFTLCKSSSGTTGIDSDFGPTEKSSLEFSKFNNLAQTGSVDQNYSIYSSPLKKRSILKDVSGGNLKLILNIAKIIFKTVLRTCNPQSSNSGPWVSYMDRMRGNDWTVHGICSTIIDQSSQFNKKIQNSDPLTYSAVILLERVIQKKCLLSSGEN